MLLQEFSVELLARVLGFVDQRQRLLSCAHVSHSWAQAARAATRHATCCLRPQKQHSLEAFRSRGDSGVQSVEIVGSGDGLQSVTLALTGLTSLVVTQGRFPRNLAPLDGLCQLRLQSCEINIPRLAAAVQGSRQSLTSLELFRLFVNVSPLLRELPHLAELELCLCTVQEDVALRALTGLRVAKLDRVELDLSTLSGAPALQQLELSEYGARDPPQLGMLQQLPELRLLRVVSGCKVCLTQLSSVSWVSGLSSLQLACDVSASEWPVLVQHVVSRTTALRELELGNSPSDSDTISLDQLQQLVRSCPLMESLALNVRVGSGAVTAVLVELPTTCTRLVINGPRWQVSALARLTWLAELEWDESDVADVQLSKLTALTRLQKQQLGYCRVSPELARAVEALLPPTTWDDFGDDGDGTDCVLHFSFELGPQVGWGILPALRARKWLSTVGTTWSVCVHQTATRFGPFTTSALDNGFLDACLFCCRRARCVSSCGLCARRAPIAFCRSCWSRSGT